MAIYDCEHCEHVEPIRTIRECFQWEFWKEPIDTVDGPVRFGRYYEAYEDGVLHVVCNHRGFMVKASEGLWKGASFL